MDVNMKYVLISVLALFLWIQAPAQNAVRLAARLGYSGIPSNSPNGFGSLQYNSDEPLASIYKDFHKGVRSSGCATASLDVIITRRIAITVDLGTAFFWKDMCDGITRQPNGIRNVGASISFLPQFRFYYLVRPVIRLYGNAGFGITQYIGKDFNSSFEPAAQLSPFGIELGRKFFGFAEMGIGTALAGIRGGIGYAF